MEREPTIANVSLTQVKVKKRAKLHHNSIDAVIISLSVVLHIRLDKSHLKCPLARKKQVNTRPATFRAMEELRDQWLLSAFLLPITSFASHDLVPAVHGCESPCLLCEAVRQLFARHGPMSRSDSGNVKLNCFSDGTHVTISFVEIAKSESFGASDWLFVHGCD